MLAIKSFEKTGAELCQGWGWLDLLKIQPLSPAQLGLGLSLAISLSNIEICLRSLPVYSILSVFLYYSCNFSVITNISSTLFQHNKFCRNLKHFVIITQFRKQDLIEKFSTHSATPHLLQNPKQLTWYGKGLIIGFGVVLSTFARQVFYSSTPHNPVPLHGVIRELCILSNKHQV